MEGKPYPCDPSVFEAIYEDPEMFAEVGEMEGVLEGEIHAALNRLTTLLLTATAHGRAPCVTKPNYMSGSPNEVEVQLRRPDWCSNGEEIVHTPVDHV